MRVRCLTDGGAPSPRPGLVELRASLVIGAGSPTFELLRRLADRLPVLPLPRYADRRLQPLAAGDIVSCLVAACDGAAGRAAATRSSGPDTLAVREMLSLVGGAARAPALAPRDAVRRARRGLARAPPRRHRAQSRRPRSRRLEEDVLVPQSDVEA